MQGILTLHPLALHLEASRAATGLPHQRQGEKASIITAAQMDEEITDQKITDTPAVSGGLQCLQGDLPIEGLHVVKGLVRYARVLPDCQGQCRAECLEGRHLQSTAYIIVRSRPQK
ncbi:hypothetical protein FNAPI_3584 [Fusarium napiforme]|uniref:Uncharacterized protein n=1 Tax=Fusarium napiforme TaxID=42672 RepID=A0A8H5JWW4_9HYPO|nr:hypothetical protein FNAPI_3584 [Fusarium napiforme]